MQRQSTGALNRDGVPSAQGGEWKPQVVRQILTNPVYVGERYGVRNAHKPIVSRRRFNEAQAMLASRARRLVEVIRSMSHDEKLELLGRLRAGELVATAPPPPIVEPIPPTS